MTDNICVSVIIPIYNMESYLERCIKSVVGQSYTNLDIILVDDGSIDGSTALCKDWEAKDKRITYIRQDNAGLGAARNCGIRAAKSEYITFLDADDWFEPTFVKRIISEMIATDSDIGECDIYYVDSLTMEKQAVKLRFDKTLVSSSEDRSVINKSRLFAWGKIFKKELIDRCGFKFPSIAYEDSVVPILVACANQVCYIKEPLINYYRNRPGSLSNDYHKIKDIGTGLQILYDKLNELNIYDRYKFEYKKIALGQLRFACRKWGEFDIEPAKNALDELEDLIIGKFSELGDISEKRYFAFGDRLLVSALDYSIPYKKQLTLNIIEADCVVAFENEAENIPQNNAQLIFIPDTEKIAADTISAAFNIAESIMEKF